MKHIGKLLKARREAFGADLEEAARWCRMPVERIAEIEASPDLSSLDFEHVCSGLAVAPAALLTGDDRSPTRSVVRFRSALSDANLVTPRDLRTVSAASEVGRTLGELRVMQGRPVSFEQHRRVKSLSKGRPCWEQGYELGETSRDRMGPAAGPIADLERELNQFGIHVAHVSFSTVNVEGASLWEAGAVPVILLNRNSTRVKYSLSRRAILAHELCHLLHDGGEANIATRATSTEGTGNWDDTLEQRARAFAPAFLAPRDQVRDWANNVSLPSEPNRRVVELAHHWGLSFEGAVWHAKNCGLIDPETADKIAMMPTQPELPSDEFESGDSGFPPSMVNPDLPDQVSPLMDRWATTVVVEALEASVISLGRAKELLLWR